MKIATSKLQRIIQEEIERAQTDPFSQARSIIFNLTNRLQHEERMGRPVLVSSDAGPDIDVLAQLTQALQLLVEYDKELRF